MIRFWLWGSIVFVINLIILFLILNTSPLSRYTETYLAIGNCQQPCWYRIQIGKPLAEDLMPQKHLLDAYYSAINFDDHQNVSSIHLVPRNELLLGHVVLTIGKPSYVLVRPWEAYLYYLYEGGMVAVLTQDSGHFSPSMVVESISYVSSNNGEKVELSDYTWYGYDASPWQGFGAGYPPVIIMG